jgi:hypothetical protein
MSDVTDYLMDLVRRGNAERLARSYTLATRAERQARLRAVIALSVELDRIQSISIYATALGNGAIGDVIEGDWDEVESVMGDLAFEDSTPEVRRDYVPLWAKFREILRDEVLLARQRGADPLHVLKAD